MVFGFSFILTLVQNMILKLKSSKFLLFGMSIKLYVLNIYKLFLHKMMFVYMLSACTDVCLYFMNTNEILFLVSIDALSDSRRL